MQDHPLDQSGAVAPASVDHLDLVTAELRRRIAGIGLAIAELREETGRLRASADERYHAVAVLDRPLSGHPIGAGNDHAAAQSVAIEPTVVPESDASDFAVRVESAATEPLPPWRDASVAVEVGAVVAWPEVIETTLTWIPDAGPVATGAPAVEAVAVAERPEGGAHAVLPAEPAPALWTDGDDVDAAAFEAFFSAEIEPEPSQRWLLSD